jgi:hypothetical protein
MGARGWVVLLLLAGGCRQLFGIDDTSIAGDGGAPDDGPGDAPAIDAFRADAPPDADPLALCPANYDLVSPSGRRYRRNTDELDWIDAVVVCAADTPGNAAVYTHLAVFATEEERAEFHQLLPTTLWLGITERVTAGTWIWITDEPAGNYPPITSPPWTQGEPDGDGECGAIDENGGFEDRPCDGTGDIPSLCECDTYPEDPTRY